MNLLKLVGFGAAVARFALPFMAALFGKDQAARSRPVFLDQGRSEEDRLNYFTTQGSAVMSYDIFLNHELASSGELFCSDKNLSGYGLIPHPAYPKYNPHGLPVGLTNTAIKDGRGKGEMGRSGAVRHYTTVGSNTGEPQSGFRAATTKHCTFFAPPGMGNRSVARKERPKKLYAILHWQYAQIVY
jgi:hypothetical protein